MISKWLGGFILGDSQQAVDKIAATSTTTGIEPRWVKVHNSIKHIKQLRAACPNTRLILRLTAPEWKFQGYVSQLESGGSPDPTGSAADFYSSLKLLIDVDTPKQSLWLEACPPGFASWAHSSWLSQYFIKFMQLAENDGFRAVICNFYTGTPHTISDGTDGWSPFMPALNYAAAHGHIIGAHAYFQLPDTAMEDPGNWTAYRPIRVANDYPFPAGTIWVPTEWSFDGPGGYRAHGISDESMRAAWNRASDKYKYASLPSGVKIDGYVGYILQPWGSEWDSFLYWAIFDQLLADMVAAGPDTGTTPPPPPPPPPPSNEIWTVKVVSIVNQRSGPSASYTWLGQIGVTNPPTILKVHSNLVNGYHEVVGQGFWLYSNNGNNLVRIG